MCEHRDDGDADGERLDGRDRERSWVVYEEAGEQDQDEQLRDLLEEVAARRVGVLEDQPPEAQAVRPRRADAQVVVDAPPQHDREAEEQPEHERDRGHVEDTERDHCDGQQHPQGGPQMQRERVTVEDDEQRHERDERHGLSQPVAAVGEMREAEQRERAEDEDGRERLALVEHVPEPGGHDLEAPRAPGVLAARADAAERGHARDRWDREQRAGAEGVRELEAVREHGQRQRLAAGHALRL